MINYGRMTLNQFEDFARTITREEFLRENVVSTHEHNMWCSVHINSDTYNCPNKVGLCEDCSHDGDCYTCWEEAVEDIRFKDDLPKQESSNVSEQVAELMDNVKTLFKSGVEFQHALLKLTDIQDRILDLFMKERKRVDDRMDNLEEMIRRAEHNNNLRRYE